MIVCVYVSLYVCAKVGTMRKDTASTENVRINGPKPDLAAAVAAAALA